MYLSVRSSIISIAKTWKQPKCPSTDEWMKKLWCIYTVEYYSTIRKDKLMPLVEKFCGKFSVKF